VLPKTGPKKETRDVFYIPGVIFLTLDISKMNHPCSCESEPYVAALLAAVALLAFMSNMK
jgi:hypothetical protein